MNKLGYYRLAAAVPQVRVADVEFNYQAVCAAVLQAAEAGASAVVLPELCLTGAGCGDLFLRPQLLQSAQEALAKVVESSAESGIVVVVGLPLPVGDSLYNVAAVIKDGELHGFVPKTCLNTEQRRVFAVPSTLRTNEVQLADGLEIPIGTDLLFTDAEGMTFGVEFGDDARSVVPVGNNLACQGARALLIPAAAADTAGSAAACRQALQQHSATCTAVCVYASAGIGESTQDSVCSGQALIADDATVVAENQRFSRDLSLTYADVDLEALGYKRAKNSMFRDSSQAFAADSLRVVRVGAVTGDCDLTYAHLPSRPFLPAENDTAACEEMLQIQTVALAARMERSYSKRLVLGISGGLDSTLALLICARVCKWLGLPPETILAITMPGFGTTGRTYQNAVDMIRLVGAELREINIKDACLQHFKDLDFDPSRRTTTYENTQARERTQILMDLANAQSGMVVGTGDLSEIALGWSTYNGDHMSMYGVNCSIPKTLMRTLIAHEASLSTPELAATLQDVIDTPVSPELLPPADDGSMDQKTEDILGPYDIHDFLLYHFIVNGADTAKLRCLALHAFADEFPEEVVDKTLSMFMRRFFSQQFKRSCSPDGPQVTDVALSPRSSWHMPSDACGKVWQPR